VPNRIGVDGPRLPHFPRSLIHPLGPIFPRLPLSLRRHLLHIWHHRTWGDFTTPRTFSEKMQWRILNDHRALLGVATDKLAAKEYARRAAARAGIPLRIPETFWVGTDPRELQNLAERLPARWVFKPNHSSGRFQILDAGHGPIDWEDIIRAGDQWKLRDEEELVLGHYGYQRARHLLLAEERVGTREIPPATLRSQVAGGEIIAFSYSYGTAHPNNPVPRRRYRYDSNFNRIADITAEGAAPLDETSRLDELGLSQRAQLTSLIRALAAGFDQVRVDLYVEEEIWFGELTMYAGSGLTKYPRTVVEGLSASWSLPDLSITDPREEEWRELLASSPQGTLQG